MNIKYIGNDTFKSENGKVHVKKGNYTACGARLMIIHKIGKWQR